MYIETLKLWEDREDVELTTFVTMPDPFLKTLEKRPAVIVCPGGAYQSCPRHGNEGDPVAMAFAMEGYQSFVLEYSVQERAPEGKTMFPAQLVDLARAMVMLREHTEEWSVDVSKISIIGFSAGAHLCGMMATSWHEPWLAARVGVSPDDLKPLTAMLIYGLLDYTVQEAFNKAHKSPMLPVDINSTVFGCPEPDEAMCRANSPAQKITENTVPIFMAAAVNDGMVNAIQSVYMAEKLHKAGIPYELHMFEYGDHGFSLGRNLFEPFRQDKMHACAQWLPLAKTFLMHHIAPETTAYEQNPFAAFENGDLNGSK